MTIPTKYQVKLYTDDEIVNFGLWTKEQLNTLKETEKEVGFCVYEEYSFNYSELIIEEAKITLLVKETEYFEDECNYPHYKTEILCSITNEADVESLIEADVKAHNYRKKKGDKYCSDYENYEYQVIKVPQY